VIGNIQSGLVRRFIGNESPLQEALQGKWECFGLKVLNQPTANISQAYVIAGSDARGTAYGTFALSEKIGVSPWYWWADVPAKKQLNLVVQQPDYISTTPSVKYRGIFINDEDWGLQPWAAQTFEPETKDIGPKTYAKVFELLLRLRANLIWPGMHPSTKPFYTIAGNKETAEAYQIMVGTSHAEPMLRNNVGEWDEKTQGHFNYLTNKTAVYKYWESRVKEAGAANAMYTMGMRGVHDSGMEGVKDPKEAVPLLERIMADQRGLFRKYINPDATKVPQVLTLYKEVLEVYAQGLTVPDDVTLIWPDDNYGYIHQLSNAAEAKRSGGAGVYYHASYWGRPHDYLWLSSTHPALIREEMMKAYTLKTDKLWVLNVGDIKPLEYNIQLFMDMAYDARPFQQSSYVPQHLQQWVQQALGAEHAATIRAILWEYYDLAFERRPEFMGWSQVEPITPTRRTEYNHFYYGDEAQRRLDRYAALEQQVRQLRLQMEPSRADAFYELVYYPVVCASLMNQKFLYQDKSYLYAKQNRASASDYAQGAGQAYASIVRETQYYNTQLAGGKWQGMMSMQPRDLPVYQAPTAPPLRLDTTQVWGVAPEGYSDTTRTLTNNQPLRLPTFYPWGATSYFVDVYLSRRQAVRWKVSASAKWLVLSEKQGALTTATGQKQQRLRVRVDWSKLPQHGDQTAYLTFAGAGKKFRVAVRAMAAPSQEVAGFAGFLEDNGYVAITAAKYSRTTTKPANHWALVAGLGQAGQTLQAQPLQAEPLVDAANVLTQASVVEYDFYTFTQAAPVVAVATLPTHPTTRLTGMRYGVALDDGPVQVVDFTTVGRSEEWKQNVLRNKALRQVKGPVLAPGRHTLKLFLIDPGVVLDRITIDMGGLKPAYGTVPETRWPRANPATTIIEKQPSESSSAN
jgi:hypothetical protein